MRDQITTPPDLAVARLADRQHGVVARSQLRAIGLDRHAVGRRVRAGRLRPLHPGVYAVGHARLLPAGRYLAAVLACGDGAVLSYHSAASLWDLRASAHRRIEVTVPMASGRRSTGAIVVHRSRRPVERTVRDGIPGDDRRPHARGSRRQPPRPGAREGRGARARRRPARRA